MNKQKDLISLKEASAISGYSADYIGQLIRDGKIYGKQIYTNISWMTTSDAVNEYKNSSRSKKKSGLSSKFSLHKRKFDIQMNILGLFFQTFKSAIPVLAVLFLSTLLLGIFVVSIFFNTNNSTPSCTIEAPPGTGQPLSF